MTVENNGMVGTTQTVAEFFNSLRYGTKVRNSAGAELVWTGRQDSDGNAKLIDRYGEVSIATLGAENTWETVKDENGNPVIESDTFLRVVNELLRQQARAQTVTKSLRAAESDWQTLNILLNEYADERNMCGEYESKIEEWNSQFSHFGLEGRKRDYTVHVTVTATWDFEMTVDGQTSEEAAQEYVENMSDDEIMSEATNACYSPDDVSLDFVSVELA